MVDFFLSEDAKSPTRVLKENLSSIISVSFNKDKTWMGVGTTLGFRIYETTDMRLIDINEGDDFCLECGISAIALLNRTILLALVTDGTNSKFPSSKVFIWDKYNKELKTEFKHASRVESITLTQKNLFVLTYNNIIVWNMENNSIVGTLSCQPSLKTFMISATKSALMVAYKDEKKELKLTNLQANMDFVIKTDVEIDLYTFNSDGTKIALVDTSGIYLYIYETLHQKLLYEFIRGKTVCKVTCLQFSEDDKFLGAINDKGTMHIFDLDIKHQVTGQEVQESLFSTMSNIASKYIPKILSGRSSFAKFHADMAEINKIRWVDAVKGKMDGPVIIFKDSKSPIKLVFESGLVTSTKVNLKDGGECQEMPEARSRWFEPFINKKTPHDTPDLDDYVIL